MGKNPAQKLANKDSTAKDKAVKAPKAKPKRPAKVPLKAQDKHCKISSCKREYRAKGYCVAHYRKWRQGEYGLARYKTCKDAECRKPIAGNRHGYCEDHFQNYYVKGIAVAHAPEPAKPKEEKVA